MILAHLTMLHVQHDYFHFTKHIIDLWCCLWHCILLFLKLPNVAASFDLEVVLAQGHKEVAID